MSLVLSRRSAVTPPPAISVLIALLLVSLVSFTSPAHAALYAPGETLDPACAPLDADCGVASVVGTGAQGQVPYYAADGEILSATSSITILANGNVGIGTTSPVYKLSVEGDAQVTGTFRIGNTPFIPLAIDDSINVGGELRVVDNGSITSLFGCNHTDPTLRCFASDIPTDTFNRFSFDANGKMYWGTGSAGQDTTLERIAAFSLQTNAALALANTLTINGAAPEITVPGTSGNLSIRGNGFLQASLVRDNTPVYLAMGVPSGADYAQISSFATSSPFVRALALNPDGGNVGIGTAAPGSSLEVRGDQRIFTSNLGTKNGLDIYHYSDQTNASNQTLPFAIHNYTDGLSAVIDTVGSNTSLVLKQARNPSARADKASSYVGTGDFLQFQRSLVNGSGNLGTGNDLLLKIDSNGYIQSYRDFDGTATAAPLQLGTYANAMNRRLYMGYNDTANKSIIGSLDSGASQFTPIDVMTSRLSVNAGAYFAAGVSIGASYNLTAPTNGLLVQGNVGIGTTSPFRKFSVTGTVAMDGLTSAVGLGSLCLTATKEVVYNAASDNCLSSTRETKHAIKSLALSELEMLQKLNPVSFVYNGDTEERKRYGFIADEADSVDSHLVTRNAEGKLSGLDTSGFLALIVGAVQELSEKVEGFANSFTTKDLNAEKLCLGSTCVTEAELQQFLNQSNQQPIAPTIPADPEPAEPVTPQTPEEPPATPSPVLLIEEPAPGEPAL